MSGPMLARLRLIVGDDVAAGPDGRPRVAPRSVDALAATLGTASEEGWTIRVEGMGSWLAPDAPADLAITTRRLDRILSVAPADLVATVQGGVTLRRLSEKLAEHRTHVALDPPGSPDRSVGSVLATATAGPAAHRFGPVRDSVLGTTIATADGKLVRSGGSVVKNVAGFDLSKVQVGGFGAFGVIAETHIRLRALPASSRTIVARGDLDPLFNAARAIVAASVDTTIVELYATVPGGRWTLVVETAGTEQGAAIEEARAREVGEVPFAPAESRSTVHAFGESMTEGPVTLRVGVLPASLPEIADLVEGSLGAGRMSLSAGRGGLRWSGAPTAAAIVALRRTLAAQEIPLTVERGPWALRQAVGHFGAFREGVRPLSNRVRDVFDPKRLLAVALEGRSDG